MSDKLWYREIEKNSNAVGTIVEPENLRIKVVGKWLFDYVLHA